MSSVEVESVEFEKPTKSFSKWRHIFLNSDANPDNDTLFDGEPYTIDNLLEFEGEHRLDKSAAPTWKKIVGFIWDPIFLPPSERRYMIKIDFFIFIYAICACFIKYLDQSSINNAYVSGMKEDLNMYGSNDYNLLTTFFNIGYLSFSIIMATLIKTVRPSIILPTCEILWTILVMCQAAAKSKHTIYGLRFVQGVTEASSFPGLTMIIGEYYSVESLAKKMFMMNATGSIASMFSGYIQASAITHHPKSMKGWQWVFIVDGIISSPVALLGYFCIPDFPENTRALWMTKKDRQFALARAKRHRRVKPKPMTVKSFVGVFLNWKLWVFLGPYAVGVLGTNYQNYFLLYLKSLNRFTLQQVNKIPTAGNGWAFLSALIYSSISDYTGNRVLFVSIAAFVGFIGTLLLSIWNIPVGAKIFAFIFGGGSSAQTIVISWFAETYYDEPDLKALNIGVGNTVVYAFNAFLPLSIYKTKEAPHFKIGYKISMMFYILGFIGGWIFWYTSRVYSRKREARILEKEAEVSSSLSEEDVFHVDQEVSEKK